MVDVGRPSLLALIIVVVLAAVLYTGWRRGRLVPAFLGAASAIAFLWALAYAAIRTDYHDADGWIDCTQCSLLQDGVGTMYSFGPIAFVLLTVATAVLVFLSRRHDRHLEAR
jgi:hypothetical protein